jgi:thymidylate synthase
MRRIYGESQYLHMIKNIMKNGIKEKGRNGITYTQIGGIMRFPLENNEIPFMTTKKLAWKVCLKELLWFMRGETDNKILQNENVKIWNGNGTRDFLDSRGLHNLRDNDLGPVYGHQWRYWNAKYSPMGCEDDYKGQGIDQLKNIIDDLKESKKTGESSRRLIMTAWNPEQINEMALPPCHVLSQFHLTEGDKLSCTLYQRSADMGLGVPFNIASYAFLTHIIAKMCDLKPKEFVHFLGNAHIYDDHIESLRTQIIKEPFEPPTLEIVQKRDKIEDYILSDFKINNYNYHDTINMKMRV